VLSQLRANLIANLAGLAAEGALERTVRPIGAAVLLTLLAQESAIGRALGPRAFAIAAEGLFLLDVQLALLAHEKEVDA
jgi:hypothetical protein